MRPALILFAAAALTGAAVSVSAAAPPDKSCDGSTYEMVDCLKAKTGAWDKELNAAYRAALEAAQPKQADQLRKAQRLWIQYRDANCLMLSKKG